MQLPFVMATTSNPIPLTFDNKNKMETSRTTFPGHANIKINRLRQPHSSSHPSLSSSSSLTAIPSSAVYSAVGHVIGGNLATPFVIDAVKTWYGRIPLPSWCPPNGIFAPVWLALYSMIGIAASRVAAIKGWKSPIMIMWGCHYVMNLIWAPLFFGMAKLRAACIVNAALVASMVPIIYNFYAVDPTAAFLLLPYTVWITFATALNVAICKLNPMDGTGYSNAMLEAQIARLQKDATQRVGL